MASARDSDQAVAPSALDQDTLAELRSALEEEKARLSRQLGEMTSDDFDDNFADSAQVTAEQVEQRTLTGQLQEQLEDVERALAKIDEGTYGLCESDGQPIAVARLEAFPASRYCIEHAGAR